MNDLLEHCSRRQLWQLLKLAHAKLNHGGRLIVKVPNTGHPIVGSDSRYLDFTHQLGFTENSLKQVLQLAEFKNVQVRGADIYVSKIPPLNLAAKMLAHCFNFYWRFLFRLYGRRGTKIFTKHLIASAEKHA